MTQSAGGSQVTGSLIWWSEVLRGLLPQEHPESRGRPEPQLPAAPTEPLRRCCVRLRMVFAGQQRQQAPAERGEAVVEPAAPALLRTQTRLGIAVEPDGVMSEEPAAPGVVDGGAVLVEGVGELGRCGG
jgi:hypothetical protein